MPFDRVIVGSLRAENQLRERPEVGLREVDVQHRLVDPLVAHPQHQLPRVAPTMLLGFASTTTGPLDLGRFRRTILVASTGVGSCVVAVWCQRAHRLVGAPLLAALLRHGEAVGMAATGQPYEGKPLARPRWYEPMAARAMHAMAHRGRRPSLTRIKRESAKAVSLVHRRARTEVERS
jgi:hypothetical protein